MVSDLAKFSSAYPQCWPKVMKHKHDCQIEKKPRLFKPSSSRNEATDTLYWQQKISNLRPSGREVIVRMTNREAMLARDPCSGCCSRSRVNRWGRWGGIDSRIGRGWLGHAWRNSCGSQRIQGNAMETRKHWIKSVSWIFDDKWVYWLEISVSRRLFRRNRSDSVSQNHSNTVTK